MKRITDPDFVYIPAANTDILKRFRAMGWTPPSELRQPVEPDVKDCDARPYNPNQERT